MIFVEHRDAISPTAHYNILLLLVLVLDDVEVRWIMIIVSLLLINVVATLLPAMVHQRWLSV